MKNTYTWNNIDTISINNLRAMNVEDIDECLEKIQNLATIKDNSELNFELSKEENPIYNLIFSHLRNNLISWLPFKNTDSVLIWGSGYGIFIDAIAPYVKHILCLEDTYISAATNYYRNNGYPNVDIILKNNISEDFNNKEEKFDYIILADQIYLEFGKFPQNNKVLKTINFLKKYMSKNGKLVFFSGNRFGLKYWSGCKDEFTNGYFSGIEGYEKHETHGMPSLKDIHQLISDIGLPYNKIYYPYPDYKYSTSIYSDCFLPAVGDLTKNAFSWEERIALFNEVRAFNNIIIENEFRLFSNSFLVISSMDDLSDLSIFIKYSNDRSEDFSIRTDIFEDSESIKYVRKIGNNDESINHIKEMINWNHILNESYHGKIHINNYTEINNGLIFEYLNDESLQTLLMHFLDNDQYDKFESWVIRIYNYLSEVSTENFYITPEFKKIFGDVDLPQGLKCSKINNIDMIFPNILVDGESIKLIDYEWVFDFPVPTKFIIFRSIYMFFHGPRGTYNYNQLYQRKILQKLSINDDLSKIFANMEKSFQKYVCGDHIPLREMCLQPVLKFFPGSIQIFYDYGKGFKKGYSDRLFDVLLSNGRGCTKIALTPDTKKLRIDPSDAPCLIKIFEITDNFGNPLEYTMVNCKAINYNTFISNSIDPQIILPRLAKDTTYIRIDIEINCLDKETIESIFNIIKS